ncbi:hypothetical protein, partial [Rhizobium sp. B209b/85]|uniref:hypothetical protein n=1 Tax=Rhizobium sp. B209b/85 TaxID=2819992 RepID=UPI001ADBA742
MHCDQMSNGVYINRNRKPFQRNELAGCEVTALIGYEPTATGFTGWGGMENQSVQEVASVECHGRPLHAVR